MRFKYITINMRKFVFAGLLLMIIDTVYGQPDMGWILGRWVSEEVTDFFRDIEENAVLEIELIFNEDGTLEWNGVDFTYTIEYGINPQEFETHNVFWLNNFATLTIKNEYFLYVWRDFFATYNRLLTRLLILKINDNEIVLTAASFTAHMHKVLE